MSGGFVAPVKNAAAGSDSGGTERLFRDLGVVKVPRIAPPVDFELNDLFGRPMRLSDFRGKVVFLNFWATWCPPCRIEMPSMQKLYDRLDHSRFAMVAVDLQEPASRVKAFVKSYKLNFTVVLDTGGEVGRWFGIRSLPTTFILNGEGGIIGKVFGPRDWESKEAIDFFEHLMTLEKE